MAKFNINWKSKKVIGTLVTAIALAFGVANPAMVSTAVTTVTCAVIECEE